MSARPLAERFAARLEARARPVPGDRVLVAVSGGVDSLALLHLLRFAPEVPRYDLVAAHFDHRMRADSGEDARWVADLARAWDVPIELGAADAPLASEQAARAARYRFLDAARARTGARWILTAHHADDQAETVLFRVARGTGVSGLRGVPARRGVLLRPLLPFWKEELAAYARASGIAPRFDPTNRDVRFARNALRAETIPGLERAVAPGARRALVRLARLAAREERAWRSVLPGLIERALVVRSDGRIVLVRDTLLGYAPPVRARVLRALLRPLGRAPDEAGTRAMLAFTDAAESGRTHLLGGGVTLAREFDRFVLSARPAPPEDRPLEIAAGGAGEGSFEIGGRRLGARWSLSASPDAAADRQVFALDDLVFPLRFRGPRPGDRIGLSYGSKKLKKLMAEARIPSSERRRVPVLVDGRGRVLWMPGIARGAATTPEAGAPSLHIGVRDEDRP